MRPNVVPLSRGNRTRKSSTDDNSAAVAAGCSGRVGRQPPAIYFLARRTRSEPMIHAANATKAMTMRRSPTTPNNRVPVASLTRPDTTDKRNATSATEQPSCRRRAPSTLGAAGRNIDPSANPKPQSQRSAVGALIRPHFGHFMLSFAVQRLAAHRRRAPHGESDTR